MSCPKEYLLYFVVASAQPRSSLMVYGIITSTIQNNIYTYGFTSSYYYQYNLLNHRAMYRVITCSREILLLIINHKYSIKRYALSSKPKRLKFIYDTKLEISGH